MTNFQRIGDSLPVLLFLGGFVSLAFFSCCEIPWSFGVFSHSGFAKCERSLVALSFSWDAAFLLTVGSFLLTVELFYSQLTILVFLLTVGAFLLTVLASLTYSWSFFAYSGKVRLIRALRDCKQRSLTVSKKAPTVSKKAFPFFLAFSRRPRKKRTGHFPKEPQLTKYVERILIGAEFGEGDAMKQTSVKRNAFFH